jgi:hypothetical protein
MSTPKQAAARLLLNALDHGKSPAQMTREEMAAVLNERVSDQKREKVLDFVTKISAPFRERLTRVAGTEAPAEGAAATDGGEEEGE